MKTFYALLIAALFTTAGCSKKKDEPAKTDPTTKAAEPAKTEPATPDPAKAEPPKTEPPKTEPAAGGLSVDEAGKISLEFSDKLAKAINDAGKDCAKMGANLKALADEAKAFKAQEKEFNKDEAKKKAFAEKYDAQLEAKMKPVLPKLEACAKDGDVQAFVEMLAAE